MHTLPAPRSNAELQAPKTKTGDRDALAASPQSTLFARLIMEKWGAQSGAALRYLLTEFSQKVALAVSILETKSQVPSPRDASLHEQKRKPAVLAMSLIQDTSQHL
jgi:hypothetical protein